jgi:hypothetical protein
MILIKLEMLLLSKILGMTYNLESREYERVLYSTNFEKQKAKSSKQGLRCFQNCTMEK